MSSSWLRCCRRHRRSTQRCTGPLVPPWRSRSTVKLPPPWSEGSLGHRSSGSSGLSARAAGRQRGVPRQRSPSLASEGFLIAFAAVNAAHLNSGVGPKVNGGFLDRCRSLRRCAGALIAPTAMRPPLDLLLLAGLLVATFAGEATYKRRRRVRPLGNRPRRRQRHVARRRHAVGCGLRCRASPGPGSGGATGRRDRATSGSLEGPVIGCSDRADGGRACPTLTGPQRGTVEGHQSPTRVRRWHSARSDGRGRPLGRHPSCYLRRVYGIGLNERLL